MKTEPRRSTIARGLFLVAVLIGVSCGGVGSQSGEIGTSREQNSAETLESGASPVPYITPSQQEGPYYPVEKPVDRDNDLVDFAGSVAEPAGERLRFSGRLFDGNGAPISDAVIEIWQTDSNGIYLHPGDPATAQRDPNFQFYGEAVTDADGNYAFRTLVPGRYEPRPRHIHVKVKRNGQELLTTQFYFASEISLQGEDAALLIDAQPAQDADGNSFLEGTRDIVLPLLMEDD